MPFLAVALFCGVDVDSSVLTAAALVDLGVTPETIAYVMGWGFGAVVSAYFFGWVVGVVKRLISKA